VPPVAGEVIVALGADAGGLAALTTVSAIDAPQLEAAGLLFESPP
jgi:hypothetical protein